MNTKFRKIIASASLIAFTFPIAACSTSSEPTSTTLTSSQNTQKESAKDIYKTQADAIQVQDAWIKVADTGRTAGFGKLINNSENDVHIIAAESKISDRMELHETVSGTDGQMMMRRKESGFTIPANNELTLQPGGNHLMFMELISPAIAGESIQIVLEFEDGSTKTFEATAKEFSGANESYVENKAM